MLRPYLQDSSWSLDSLSPRARTGLELNLHTVRKFDNSFDIRIRYFCHVNCVASFWRENEPDGYTHAALDTHVAHVTRAQMINSIA